MTPIFSLSLSVCLSRQPFFHSTQTHPNFDWVQCRSHGLLEHEFWNPAINLMSVILASVIPFMVIGYCYLKIYLITRDRATVLSREQSRCSSGDQNIDDSKNVIYACRNNFEVSDQGNKITDKSYKDQSPLSTLNGSDRIATKIQVERCQSVKFCAISERIRKKVLTATKTLVLIHVMTCLPYVIISIYWIVNPGFREEWNRTVYNILFFTSYTSSAINPFVYGNILKRKRIDCN